MKIKVNRKSMEKCLKTVSKALPLRTIIPIYDNFLFVISFDTCYVYASNGNMQIKGQFAVESKQDFSMCVPGRTLMNTIGLMTDEEINLNYNDEKFILNVSAGKKRYKLTGHNPFHFHPKVIEEGGLKMNMLSSKIIPQISTVSKVVKWDDLRPQLSGITINSIENDITVSGAHESFYFCRTLLGVKADKEFGIVLPKDVSIAISQMQGAGETTITIYDKSVFFNLDGFELYTTLISVNRVVNLEKLFCHNREEYITVGREEMATSLKRLINYSTENSVIRMELTGTELKLSCENEDYGKDAEEIIDVDNHDNKDTVVGISIKYLSSILNTIQSDKVKLFMLDYRKMVFIQRNDLMDDSEVWGCAPMILKEHAK